MSIFRRAHLGSGLLVGLGAVLGAALIVRAEWREQREAFETDARIAHRLMSQRVVQHDAVLATLALMAPASAAADRPEQRLPSVYPQVLRVQRRDAGQAWGRPELAEAEAQSRQRQRAVLARLEPAAGRYELVAAAGEQAFALQIDLQKTVPWDEWPMAREHSPVRVELRWPGQPALLIQPGAAGGGPGFRFEKTLASESQSFKLVAERPWGWADWPWARLALWVLLVGAATWAGRAWRRQAVARRRAEELLRLGQVSRLNTLGELAAGVAHELNQPLTAVLANTQAASRLLDDEAADPALLRKALHDAGRQARRAADVVGRLRRLLERPDASGAVQPVALEPAVRNALHLLEPELRRLQVQSVLESVGPVVVRADPVALDQIVHNLITNALHAVAPLPVPGRSITLRLGAEGAQGVLRVLDSGPGLSAEALQRLFQPFFSTRPGGLGLGLSLCETLAVGMGGTLAGRNAPSGGAEFTLSLPLADLEPPPAT